MTAAFPIAAVRAQFPALATTDAGRRRIYFDAPGGTQICSQAIARMGGHLSRGTANSGGAFASSAETDAISREAHEAMADLLGGDPGEIAFGPNMTTLTLAVSRSLSQEWRAGDEVVVTRLDHDANVAPWLLAARDRGTTVRWIDFDTDTGRLRLEDVAEQVGPRTRLVALGSASNALGTLNPVPRVVELVRERSDAVVFVDAVQAVPHLPVDVAALGCDLLVCSPYKFFGPHQGVLWGKAPILGQLEAYKVRPASVQPPAVRFETGTQSFEGQAAVLGTIEYLEWLGREVAPGTNGGRRALLRAAMEACRAYEQELSAHLLAGLADIDGLRLWGPPSTEGRVPTFAFTIAGKNSREVAAALGEAGVFAWAGHFYAVETLERLQLADTGGLVRVGLCHYNEASEVDWLLELLRDLAS